MDFVILNNPIVPDPQTGRICFDFRLVAPDGNLVRGVTEFTYKEDDLELSPYESDARPYSYFEPYVHTLLLLDLSNSIVKPEMLTTLKSTALDFVRTLPANPGNPQSVHPTAVVFFDGSRDLRSKVLVTFTTSLPELEAGIARIDANLQQDRSTNLHGAVLKSLQLLEQQVSKESYGARLVVLSDFRHRAGVDGGDYPSWELTKEYIRATHHSIFAVGFGPELDEQAMKAIGRDGAQKLDGVMPDISTIFVRWNQWNQRYRICYCSAARAGSHTLQVEAKKDELSGMYRYVFNAQTHFALCTMP